jgi:hypothetical protein
MTRKRFYNLSLSLPYLALLISGVSTYLMNGVDFFSLPSPSNLLSGTLAFFTFSAVIWGPLYTWMVAVMLFWGRGKRADQIRFLYLLSPVLLAFSMGFPVLLLSLPTSGAFLLWGLLRMVHLDFLMSVFFGSFYLEQAITTVLAWVFMAALCIVVGYLFVGGALLIERALKRRGLFAEEKQPDEAMSILEQDEKRQVVSESTVPSLGYGEHESKGI